MQNQERASGFKEAYAQALRLLERGEAAAAQAQLQQILKRIPGEVNSQRVLALALFAQGRNSEGIAQLEAVIAAAPNFPHAMVDLAQAYRLQGRLEPAAALLRKALNQDSSLHDGWRLFADLLVGLGEFGAARRAYQEFVNTDRYGTVLEEAKHFVSREQGPKAEAIFRRILREDANHIGALCGLAAVSLSAGHLKDAERLLKHALKQSAHMPLIRRGLAQTYLELGEWAECEAAVRHSLLIEADSPAAWVVLGSVLAHTMRQLAALEAYDQALALEPNQIRVALARGHVLKTLGRRAEAEAVYHRCLELQPDFGEAFYSLADMKNYVFSDAQVAAMEEVLRTSPNADQAQVQINFALARAFEQRKDFSQAFRHYAAGNVARRREAPFDAAGFEDKCRRVAATFSAPFLAARAGCGSEDRAPIFVVGLPRSGSTLVEQVLASHSLIEGTMELPNVLRYVRELDYEGGADTYPESLIKVPNDSFRALGQRFIKETQIYRSGRPRFIDKMPNNFSHVGLIHLMLPKATVIDVRRHPMDACFSAYKQHFAQGQSFSYDLEDLGRYYRSYLLLMDHWDLVLPGKVFHLCYEDLVRDTETQVRALIAHCGLEFEPACLRFHETKRSVRTASSEQVRMPIYDSGIGYWRHFEAQLEPLRRSLGGALERFAAD
jgi:predicted Zn-dependent protease